MEQQQNTRDWLIWRLNGIGASDAPAIMGASKYKTKLQLWDEKFNKVLDEEENEPNFIQQKGHTIEAWARPGLEFQTGFSWAPATFTHKEFDFIRASLDGYCPELKEAWECKFMGKDLWETLANEELKVLDRIPPQYFDQIMQQFFVSGAGSIRLTGVKEWKDENDVKQKQAYTLKIINDVEVTEYINTILVPKLFEFWKSVQDGVRPEPAKTDVIEITDESFLKDLKEYVSCSGQKKILAEDVKKYKAKVYGPVEKDFNKIKAKIEKSKLRNHNKMSCDGFKLTEVSGSEMIDYKAAFESFVGWIKNLRDNADTITLSMAVSEFPDVPNMEQYTTAGKPSFKITVPKKHKIETKVIEKKEEWGEHDKLPVIEKEVSAEEAAKNLTDAMKISGVPVTIDIEKTLQEPGSTEKIEVKPKDALAEWKEMTPEQQKVQAESNGFKNPETEKMPRGWANKTREQRIKYLRQNAKKKETSEYGSKRMLELADKLESLDKKPETIGGITFEK